MNILGIETSCDETAAAVVKDGCEVLANVVYTQIPLHQPYGGVVPEIASRAHIEKITEVIRTCLAQFRDYLAAHPDNPNTQRPKNPNNPGIDAVAVTYGAGLSPALIVGLNAAKGLAMSLGVPLIGINHIEAHLHTPFLRDAGETVVSSAQSSAVSLQPTELCPALGLAISGGHTNWIDIPEYGQYEIIGQTLDDAAGEAFDKAAKLLGLGYPGGPKIDKIAKEYLASLNPNTPSAVALAKAGQTPKHPNTLIPFPKGHPREGVTALAGLPAELCVSFSGLKTALLRYVQKEQPTEADIPRVVASYQEAIVQAVAERTRNALKRRNYKALILGGGVSLNSRVRAVLSEVCARAKIPLLMAKPKYCGDNGAMIAGLAYYRRNLVGEEAMRLDVHPSLEAGD